MNRLLIEAEKARLYFFGSFINTNGNFMSPSVEKHTAKNISSSAADNIYKGSEKTIQEYHPGHHRLANGYKITATFIGGSCILTLPGNN